MSSIDDIIELYKKDVDVTLLRENLKKSYEERILALQAAEQAREQLQKAVERERDKLR